MGMLTYLHHIINFDGFLLYLNNLLALQTLQCPDAKSSLGTSLGTFPMMYFYLRFYVRND